MTKFTSDEALAIKDRHSLALLKTPGVHGVGVRADDEGNHIVRITSRPRTGIGPSIAAVGRVEATNWPTGLPYGERGAPSGEGGGNLQVYRLGSTTFPISDAEGPEDPAALAEPAEAAV